MKNRNFVLSILMLFMLQNNSHLLAQTTYTFPDETEEHEGTWLTWPHQYEYGMAFRNENDATWVAMTRALQVHERVHIIAYNNTEKTRITNLLKANGGSIANVDFKIFQTNDVWIRDNGPIYARNETGDLVIQDYGFNGWGGDYRSAKDTKIPSSIANATGMTVINLNNALTIEGGAYEMDGAGTLLATKSSITSQSNPAGTKSIRNPGKSQAQVETILAQNLGAKKFIWLEGWFDRADITDAHVDGFAKFAPGNKLVTMNQTDLQYWGVPKSDINKLYAAKNINNVAYTKVYLPLTKNDVKKTNGQNLGYKGSYVNYYVANKRVLVPNYNDPNDAIANGIIANLYPNRTVIGIDVRNLYGNGGMVHCVTQQQPKALTTPPIVDTQAPTTPTNLKAEGTTQNRTNLSWNASTDNVGVTGYLVYKGNSLITTLTTTVYTATDLTAETAYTFTIKAKDAAGNISSASNVVSVTTLPIEDTPPNNNRYCESAGYDTSGEIIKKVIFGTINKNSSGTNGYEDFTYFSTDIAVGNRYKITIKPKWFYGRYREGYAVYIDYNQDGDFTDVGEKVWSKSPTRAKSVSGNIIIPTAAQLGATRMRISMKGGAIPTPCGTFEYGQVEDYTINITRNSVVTTDVPSSSRVAIPNSQLNQPMIKIFPNPASSYIEISGEATNGIAEIYSATGRLVKRINLGEKGNWVDIADFQTGLYFLKYVNLTNPALSITSKFYKQ